MFSGTVSAKGQITLPADARKTLGLKPHDRVLISVRDNAIVIQPAPDFFALKGFLGGARAVEDEERSMLEGVAQHVLEQE